MFVVDLRCFTFPHVPLLLRLPVFFCVRFFSQLPTTVFVHVITTVVFYGTVVYPPFFLPVDTLPPLRSFGFLPSPLRCFVRFHRVTGLHVTVRFCSLTFSFTFCYVTWFCVHVLRLIHVRVPTFGCFTHPHRSSTFSNLIYRCCFRFPFARSLFTLITFVVPLVLCPFPFPLFMLVLFYTFGPFVVPLLICFFFFFFTTLTFDSGFPTPFFVPRYV